MVHAISSEFTLNLITLTLIRLVDYRNEQLRKVWCKLAKIIQ